MAAPRVYDPLEFFHVIGVKICLNTVTVVIYLFVLLIVMHIKCLTLFNSTNVFIITANIVTYLLEWFIMNYDICLYCTVKDATPSDSDLG